PRGQESSERLRRHRLDLAPELRERFSAERSEDLGVAELAPAAASEEGTLEHATSREERRERGLERRRAEAEATRDVLQLEGTVRAREAREEITDRIGDPLEERFGEAARRNDA